MYRRGVVREQRPERIREDTSAGDLSSSLAALRASEEPRRWPAAPLKVLAVVPSSGSYIQQKKKKKIKTKKKQDETLTSIG
jgi:hypothetical protein